MRRSRVASRAARGWLFAAAWMLPGLAWMWSLTIPGYFVAVAVFAGFHAVAATASPQGPWRVIGRPAAHTLAEALRLVVPVRWRAVGDAADRPGRRPVRRRRARRWRDPADLGGVPDRVRARRTLAVRAASWPRKRGRRRGGAVARRDRLLAAVIVVVIIAATVAPDGTDVADPATLRVAAVQGGGQQGTRAINSDPRVVFERHLDATQTIEPGSVDLVVWPENVIDVAVVRTAARSWPTSPPRPRGSARRSRSASPRMPPGDHFINAQVVVTPDGQIVVAIREGAPGARSASTCRCAACCTPWARPPISCRATPSPAPGPPISTSPVERPAGVTVRAGVVISWEVFFGRPCRRGGRPRRDVHPQPDQRVELHRHDPADQQIASSRLRAIENGRWVVQVSPTGFSAFVSPDGDVLDRTAISEQKVITRTIALTSGRTWYSTSRRHPSGRRWC